MFKKIEELEKEKEDLEVRLKEYEHKINWGKDTWDDREQYKKYNEEICEVVAKITKIMGTEIAGD